MNETYLIDRCISMARECERLMMENEALNEELEAAEEKVQTAMDRIAVLESVELLQELESINGTRKKQGEDG